MITFFYTFAIFFMFNEIYYVYNKIELDTTFNDKDKNISSLSKMQLAYYVMRVLYWIWLIIGLFSPMSNLFTFLLILRSLKFPFFHISKKFYVIWDNLLPAISFIFMLMILIFGIIG